MQRAATCLARLRCASDVPNHHRVPVEIEAHMREAHTGSAAMSPGEIGDRGHESAVMESARILLHARQAEFSLVRA